MWFSRTTKKQKLEIEIDKKEIYLARLKGELQTTWEIQRAMKVDVYCSDIIRLTGKIAACEKQLEQLNKVAK